MLGQYLDARVADVADFLAVEPLPLLLVEALHERDDVCGLDHVDEGVANIALVLEVDGQVEEVVHAAELLINGLQQHLLRVFVGDVLDHQRRARVLACTTRPTCQLPLSLSRIDFQAFWLERVVLHM